MNYNKYESIYSNINSLDKNVYENFALVKPKMEAPGLPPVIIVDLPENNSTSNSTTTQTHTEEDTQRVCGAQNIPPCNTGFYETTVKDPLDTNSEYNCCLIDPNRNDTTIDDMLKNIAIDLAKDIAVGVVIDNAVYVTGHLAIRGGAKVMASITGTLTRKLGAAVGTKFATKIVTALAIKTSAKMATTTGVKLGATIAAKTSVKAAMGPVGWALLAFDIFSASLDLADPGGYANVQLLEQFIFIRDKTNEMFNNSLIKQGIKTPLIIGPDVKLPDTIPDDEGKDMGHYFKIFPFTPQSQKQLQMYIIIERVYLTFNSILPKLMDYNLDEQRFDTVTNDLIGIIIDKIIDYFSTEDGLKTFANRSCDIMGGVYDNGTCSYIDKATCDSSYDWTKIRNSLKNNEDSNELYVEWKNNKCVFVSPTMRSSCEDSNFPYDYDKQICKLSDEYCRMKGMDPVQTNDGTDCKVGVGQTIAELIFGTTITRGLIQVFDPKQYKPCNPGDYDMYNGFDGLNPPILREFLKTVIGRTLTIAAGSTGVGTLVVAMMDKFCVNPNKGCAKGKVVENTLCYTPCRDGYKSDGSTLCYANTPPNWPGKNTISHLQHDTKYSPAKVKASCPPGKIQEGALCFTPCTFDSNDKNNQYKSDGATLCYKQYPDFENNGLLHTITNVTKKTIPRSNCPDPIPGDTTGWSYQGSDCVKNPINDPAIQKIYNIVGVDESYEVRPGDIVNYHLKESFKSYVRTSPPNTTPSKCVKWDQILQPDTPPNCGSGCARTITTDNCCPTGIKIPGTPGMRGACKAQCCRAFKCGCGGCGDNYRYPGIPAIPDRYSWGCNGNNCGRTTSCVACNPRYANGACSVDGYTCPGGYTKVGTSCLSCPQGKTLNGLLCYEPCRSGYHDVAGVCWTDKPWTILIPKEAKRKSGCPEGYTDNKLGLCTQNCPDGTTDIGISCVRASYTKEIGTPPSCGANEEQKGLLCYEKCSTYNKDGFEYERTDGNVESCTTKCPTKTTNVGIGGCQRDSYNRGVGDPQFSIYMKQRLAPYGKKDGPSPAEAMVK